MKNSKVKKDYQNMCFDEKKDYIKQCVIRISPLSITDILETIHEKGDKETFMYVFSTIAAVSEILQIIESEYTSNNQNISLDEQLTKLKEYAKQENFTKAQRLIEEILNK